MANVLEGDWIFRGQVSAQGLFTNTASITNAMVHSAADIDATKMEQQYVQVFTQPNGTAATTVRQVIHTVRGATGTIVNFRAGVVTANVGAATISIQLKKNGSNILSSALVLDNTNTAFSFENAAGFTSAALAANDVLEVDVTATAGGGTLGQGLFIELTTREDA